LNLPRIRCHGDLGLGRLVSTGSEFVVTELSGPGSSPFIERRLKRIPLWDVVGMLESFHEAASVALADQESLGEVSVERWSLLEKGAAAWYTCVAQTYFHAYRKGTAGTPIELGAPETVDPLLKVCLLDRTVDRLASTLLDGSHEAPVLVRRLLELLEPRAPLAPDAATSGGAPPPPA
jgi:maltose alpha-D-glucosyltransferase / alpha-amylase